MIVNSNLDLHRGGLQMIKDIVKDIDFLRIPLDKASKEDRYILQDILDTAYFHKENCLGIAANQIGYNKKIIAVRTGEDEFMIMINPLIVKKSAEKYLSIEGCLSLEGTSEVVRHKRITVMYSDTKFKIKKLDCFGLLAKIVQHEVDHCYGILI
jgi:peptide deformylase